MKKLLSVAVALILALSFSLSQVNAVVKSFIPSFLGNGWTVIYRGVGSSDITDWTQKSTSLSTAYCVNITSSYTKLPGVPMDFDNQILGNNLVFRPYLVGEYTTGGYQYFAAANSINFRYKVIDPVNGCRMYGSYWTIPQGGGLTSFYVLYCSLNSDSQSSSISIKGKWNP